MEYLGITSFDHVLGPHSGDFDQKFFWKINYYYDDYYYYYDHHYIIVIVVIIIIIKVTLYSKNNQALLSRWKENIL